MNQNEILAKKLNALKAVEFELSESFKDLFSLIRENIEDLEKIKTDKIKNI